MAAATRAVATIRSALGILKDWIETVLSAPVKESQPFDPR